jgi:hypothetical protein
VRGRKANCLGRG